jgi:cell division transport system permease protein
MKPVRSQTAEYDSKENFQSMFESWSLQHMQAFFFSLGQLCRNPVASFLTAAVIGISLALPAGFYIILENTRYITAGWEGSVEITAFLKMDVSDDAAKKLAEKISDIAGIAKVEVVTREQALEEYRQLSGFARALEALEDNPLPSLLLVKPAHGDFIEKSAEDILTKLRKIPEIENAQYDQQWVQRLNAIIEIFQRIVVILAVFLGLAVLIIIGNTIRMLIYHRRAEIEVAKLFGATDGFIQRPFLYSGFWYGIFGGLIAWLLINISLLLLQAPAESLAQLYASDFSLIGLTLKETLLLFLSGVLLGLIGSWISVQRHLRAIEPA